MDAQDIPEVKVVRQRVQTGDGTQPNEQSDQQMLPSALSPCFAKATRSIKISDIKAQLCIILCGLTCMLVNV